MARGERQIIANKEDQYLTGYFKTDRVIRRPYLFIPRFNNKDEDIQDDDNKDDTECIQVQLCKAAVSVVPILTPK